MLSIVTSTLHAANEFRATADHEVQPNVPQGQVRQMAPWKSEILKGTVRDWWVYVPAQLRADQPAALMVFQDGHDYVNVKGNWRVPIVLDNLIARGEMPPTIAVFINPGHDLTKGDEFHDVKWRASNRSDEYDSLGNRYARFLVEEIIPELKKSHSISDDPDMRAICGASSGGICSFTVAWERPDQFRKVLSTIGYDSKFDYVEGYAHNSNHGGSVFPEALRWLWRKEKAEPKTSTRQDLGGDLTLLKLLVEGETWQLVAEGLGFADGPCADAEGMST